MPKVDSIKIATIIPLTPPAAADAADGGEVDRHEKLRDQIDHHRSNSPFFAIKQKRGFLF